MENKNKKSFTITITEDDKYLYDYINEELEISDDEDIDNVIKSALESDIKALKNVMGNAYSSKSFPSPETLKEILKDKKKEELLNLRETFKNDILNYSSLFNQNITLNGISFNDKDPKSWYVSDNNPVAYIILYSNYIDMINSLIDKKPFKDNSFEALLAAICIPEQNKAKITKKGIAAFIKSRLTDLEAKIIIARYGLGTAKPKSLLDLSKDLSITREKIRQITEKAIFKLRTAVLDEETEKEIYNIK